MQNTRHSAGHAVAALDDVLWKNIIEFLPMPKDLNPNEIKNYDATVSDIVATYKTLLNLRLVTKQLATLLHPTENKALWRRLLLQSFDFSVETRGFNTDFHVDYPRNRGGVRRGLRYIEEVWADGDPRVDAMRGRRDRRPAEYLEEDLVQWPKLGIYLRASQYGFLTTVQQSLSQAVWPESEDAFSLFGDLVRLLQLPHGWEMEARGEGSDTTFKFLAAPTEADSSSPFYCFYVMKTLGYVPHCWDWGRGIGGEWKGFTEPEAFDASVKNQFLGRRMNDDMERDAGFDDDEQFAFPGCRVGGAKRLYGHIREHCQDWRSVCCNEGSDGYTPVFFVGESQASPHRWIGYAGGKCWT